MIILTTLLVFLLTHLLPGGAARATLGAKASATAIRDFNIANGYNKPFFIQYLDFLLRLLHGNLGYSYHYNQSVSSLIGEYLPKSLILVVGAVLVALVIAVPIGLFQADRRNKAADHSLTGVAFVLYSMPMFWLGMLLIVIFSVTLNILPPEAPQGATVAAILADPQALVLPILTLALVTLAAFSRYMRSSAIDVLAESYILTARAKGLGRISVLRRHVLRNSLLPIVTLLGVLLPWLISGALVVESVFNYPGMGLLYWTAISSRDYPTVVGATIVSAVATVVGSLLADIAYAVLDPRIRYTGPTGA